MKTSDFLKNLNDEEIFKACLSILERHTDTRDVDLVIDRLIDRSDLEDLEDPFGYSDLYPIIYDRIKEQYREASLYLDEEY
jgi:hypothetical protein